MKTVRICMIIFALNLVMVIIACSDDNEQDDNGQIVVPDPTIAPCIIQTPMDGQVNLFNNPGFENGAFPWCVLRPPMFKLDNDLPHTGQYSARLHLNQPANATGNKIHYLVQEISLAEFPEFLSGYYRVEKWNKGTPDQYLQFVIGVIGAENRPLPDVSNHQIRYLLAGISDDPFGIRNAKFVYIRSDEPVIGEWVYFQRNIKEDFVQLWGDVPENFSSIRFFFEVRYDNKKPGNATEAVVYYDDLYLGSAAGNTNKPFLR